MENAQTLNLQPLRSNDELERENESLRKSLEVYEERARQAGNVLFELMETHVATHVDNALFDFDVMQEVNNNIADLDTSGLDIDLWDHEDEIREILNSILKNSSIKLELY